jgi:hypothetical protein
MVSRISWSIGSLFVAGSVGEMAYLAHGNIQLELKQKLQNAVQI